MDFNYLLRNFMDIMSGVNQSMSLGKKWADNWNYKIGSGEAFFDDYKTIAKYWDGNIDERYLGEC